MSVADSTPPIDAATLAAALDALPEAIAIASPDGSRLFANRGFQRLFGDAAAALPAGAAEVMVPAKGRGEASVRRIALGADGALLLAAHGPDDGDLYREILDALDCTVVVYDGDEHYVLGNDAFHALYPFHPPDEELVGRTFESMLRSSIAQGHAAEPQAVNDPEGFVRRRLEEFRDLEPGRSERMTASGRWQLLSVRYLPDGHRISVRTDITEQKRTQEELRRATERLEAEGTARAAFLDHLSRELRTPLGSVLGYAELIEGQVLGPIGSDKYREYAALIRHAGQHLLSLVADVLDSKRIRPDAQEMREETVDLVDLLRRELTVIEPMARENQTAIYFDLPEGMPALRADPRMVRQMVLNLLTNAVKFTSRQPVTVSLRRGANGGLELVVADRGAGMTPEVLARVGEPYFRGGDAGGAGETGTGLGLSVVKELLALHDSHLRIESALGRGTTATLVFPPERAVPSS